MKNEMSNRQAVYALASLLCYIVSCYIAFSEPWTAGAMKLFMAAIIGSGVLFVYFCGRLSFKPLYLQELERTTTPVPGYSAAK